MEIQKIEEFRKQIRFLEREIFEQLKSTSCCGISMAQCHVLLEIGDSESTTISNLAEALRLDKSTLSRTIEGLVRTGLVSREIDSQDRRYMCVTLTEQGRKTYNSINTLCNQYYLSVFANIHESRHAQIIESLVILAESMHRIRENQSYPQCVDISEIRQDGKTAP